METSNASSKLASNLEAATAQITGFRAMHALGTTLTALTNAARAGVTLGPEHLAQFERMQAFARDAWPTSCFEAKT